jgi:archaellum component FlaD/FlaE
MNNSTFKATVPRVHVILGLAAVALTVGIAFSINATAKSMSITEYNFLAKKIEAEFTKAKIRCDSILGNAFEKCLEEAVSIKDTSKMELDTKRKIIKSTESSSISSKADSERNMKTKTTNSMPILDKLNPILSVRV